MFAITQGRGHLERLLKNLFGVADGIRLIQSSSLLSKGEPLIGLVAGT